MSSDPAHVVLVDSGVKLEHPHVLGLGEVVHGATFNEDGTVTEGEQVDLLGHGTAACAAILDLAPGTRVTSLRVFHDRPECPFEHVVAALRHAVAEAPDLINLSLGTTRLEWRDPLADAVAALRAVGTRVVAPASFRGLPSYPGSLDMVEGVVADPSCLRGEPVVVDQVARWWRAAPWPRDLPGIPRDRNFHGESFAVANVVGFLAKGSGGDKEPQS